MDQLSSPHDREADTWVLRGMAYRKLNKSSQSLLAYKEADALEPGRADILYNMGNLLSDIRPHDAIKAYYSSLKIDPFSAACWFNHGLACLNVGDFKSAIRSFVIGLKIEPMNDELSAIMDLHCRCFTG